MTRTRGVLLALALATGTTAGTLAANAGAEDPHPVHHDGHHHLCHTDHEGNRHDIQVTLRSAEGRHLHHGDDHGTCA